ncbi:MAG: hypothetical protein IH800_15900 [Myxococcales bacterium]|nr:hypothetical protein [Myxococcales bacterium]
MALEGGVVALVLLTAVLHASWNAVVKSSGDQLMAMALVMGTGALATVAYSFIRIQVSLSGTAPMALKKLLNSPFEGINQMMRHAMQIDWGWGLLLGGAILVIAAGNIKGYRV